MARNMKKTNADCFANIQSLLDEDLAEKVPNCIRYICTTEEEKIWLKSLSIQYSYRFSRDSFALLLCLNQYNYLCLINIEEEDSKLPPYLEEIPVNAGLVTVLGAEKFLLYKIPRRQQFQILDELLYDTSAIGYHGHQHDDIMKYFSIHCYQIVGETGDVDIRANINMFYQILCQAVFEFDWANNPYTQVSKEAWEKSFYEGALSKINFKSLLMAYTALTWDIAYLYLYQCLEDKFTCEAVRSLHGHLGVNMTEQELSDLLYQELSWQPRDMDGIESIINSYSDSVGVQFLQKIANGEKLSKLIYSIRNSIVHETKAARIPLEDNIRWENAIVGILYLLLDI